MATRKACLSIGVVLVLGVGLFGEEPHEQVSRQRLDKLSAALENDETRMSAVRALIAFAGDQLYMRGSVRTSSGDPEKDRLMWEAGDILLRWVNVETIGKALADPDRNVQWWALTYFIAWNSRRAPMWQFPFGQAAFDRVVELTRSPLESERTVATSALQELYHLDRETARATLLGLAGDPSEGVRQQVARGLAVEADRADVRAALVRRLDDPAVGVRFQAIRVLGPEEHVEQLREISRGGDPRYADRAAELLKKVHKN